MMVRVGTLLGALAVLVARADPRDEFGPSFGLAHAVFTPAECEAIVVLMEAKATRERGTGGGVGGIRQVPRGPHPVDSGAEARPCSGHGRGGGGGDEGGDG